MSAPQRLLVIGARGFVGGHLLQAAAGRFQPTGAGRSGCVLPVEVGDPASVAAAFEKTKPAVVALAAAMADIDACERQPDEARRTNVEGPRNVARECARMGARLLFTSSGAVFDGLSAEYHEDSPTSPVSVYGATKAEAEYVITSIVPDAVIARFSLVLGPACRPGTNSLVERMRREFDAGRQVAFPRDEWRNAIDAETVVGWMLDLASNARARGIFHLGSADALSRYEIATELARAMGYSSALVTAEEQPRPGRAPRGPRELLAANRIGQFSHLPVPDCREAIQRSVNAIA
jgi:dTDP-4-dehydrorhamnose reductase